LSISNGYCTLAEYKDYASITSTNATDDGVLESIIEAASRFMDDATGRTFYARTETRKYDIPIGRELHLDDDLLTVTTLTNGDDTTIPNTEYNLLPANVYPKRSIKLRGASSYTWQTTSNGDTEQIIDVAGTWGWTATTPTDVKEATRQIAKNVANRRSGENATGESIVTAGGVVITPQDLSGFAKLVIAKYRKRT
jgi:hypothetical protein